jgi:hypothetical protein
VETFGKTHVPGPVDVRVAADGSLWYLARGNSFPPVGREPGGGWWCASPASELGNRGSARPTGRHQLRRDVAGEGPRPSTISYPTPGRVSRIVKCRPCPAFASVEAPRARSHWKRALPALAAPQLERLIPAIVVTALLGLAAAAPTRRPAVPAMPSPTPVQRPASSSRTPGAATTRSCARPGADCSNHSRTASRWRRAA